MIILDCQQGSKEWHVARLGIPTASRFSDIMTPVKRQYAEKGASSYMNELIAELINGEVGDKYMSPYMQDGKDYEDEARRYYEWKVAPCTQVGLIYPDDNKDIACSPDSLVRSRKRGLEIKCPKLETIIEWISAGTVPDEHMAQVQGSMMIASMNTWDFMPYHRLIPEPPIFNVVRDVAYITQLQRCLIRFKIEMAERLQIVLKTGATIL